MQRFITFDLAEKKKEIQMNDQMDNTRTISLHLWRRMIKIKPHSSRWAEQKLTNCYLPRRQTVTKYPKVRTGHIFALELSFCLNEFYVGCPRRFRKNNTYGTSISIWCCGDIHNHIKFIPWSQTGVTNYLH